MTFRHDEGRGVAVAELDCGELQVLGGLGARLLASSFHLDEGPELAWVNPYRLLARGRLLGYGRTTPCSTFTVDDGEAVVSWEPFEDHAARLSVRSSVVDGAAFDTTFTATATATLEDYEAFVSSYFTPNQTPTYRVRPYAYVDDGSWFTKDGREGEATTWPRDGRGAQLVFDGRWEVGHPPLFWTIGSFYAAPIAVQSHRWAGLSIVMMARRSDCFALGALQGYHNSSYFHLFGETLAAGQEVSATVRTMVVVGRPQAEVHELALQAYAAFDPEG